MAHHDTEIHDQMCEQMTQLQGVCVQIFFYFNQALYAMNSYGMGSSSCGSFLLVVTK